MDMSLFLQTCTSWNGFKQESGRVRFVIGKLSGARMVRGELN